MKLSQDIALGAFFATVGVVSASIAVSYPFGTASRMGPGYFPLIISTLLTLTGIAILMRAGFGGSGAIQPGRWLPLVVVPGAIVLFGLLIGRLGLPLAVLLLTVGAATASIRFRLSWKAAAGAVVFSVICAVLFVKLLGLFIPMVGTWLPGAGG